MRVLLVEDDTSTAKTIEMMLKSEGYICDCTDLGEDGLEIGKIYDYDLIILDLMLPDMDGYEVLRRLRSAKVKTPILILSGLTEPDQKVKGLGFGADDYLTKPFDKGELVACIQAIVRRSKGYSESIIRTGKISVNLDTRTVEVNNQPLHLTGKEYGILELLSLRKGTTLTKEMFLNHLYGGMDEPELKIIDVFVCKLRKKLSTATGGENYIETVWGRGCCAARPWTTARKSTWSRRNAKSPDTAVPPLTGSKTGLRQEAGFFMVRSWIGKREESRRQTSGRMRQAPPAAAFGTATGVSTALLSR